MDVATGESQLIGSTGLNEIVEGDFAADPATGSLCGRYVTEIDTRRLFTLDTDTGPAAVLPGPLTGDPSAMAFDPAGAACDRNLKAPCSAMG